MTLKESDKRDFSLELTSSQHLMRFSSNGGVLIEGTLGKLIHACFVEPEILEVKGSYGVLRLNVRSNEIAVAKPTLEVKGNEVTK